MLWLKVAFLLGFASVLDGQTLGGPTHGKKVICYWASWSYYYPVQGHSRFQLGKVDPTLCTHMVYFSAHYDSDKHILKTLNPWLDFQKDGGMGNFKGIVSLKEQYPHLKVTISIGGLTEGSAKFSKMAADPELRKLFVKAVVRFLKHFGFDGLDFHWQYPTLKSGAPYDRENFVQVAKELSEAFKPKGYILSIIVGCAESTLEASYDFAKLSRYVDLFHMRSWNYHDSGDRVVGASAPLRGIDGEDNESVEYSMKYILAQGVPAHKLVLGLAFHGRTYTLTNSDNRNVDFGDTPAKHDGFKGPYSKLKGFMDYIEICLALSNTTSNWEYHWEDTTETPYLQDEGKVISYDNPRSIAHKIKFAIEKNLGGLLVWTIDSDDYLGICSHESHHEEEAYEDFSKRLDHILQDPMLEEALKTLYFPDEDKIDPNEGPTYVKSNGKLKLHLPQSTQPVKFKLTHFTSAITKLIIQEKRIVDEMNRLKKEIGPNKKDIPSSNSKVTSIKVVIHPGA